MLGYCFQYQDMTYPFKQISIDMDILNEKKGI